MTEVRWEREELTAANRQGRWERWGAQDDVALVDGWLTVPGGWRHDQRVYAPTEHDELPSQFATAAASDDALLRFVRTYGLLGFQELGSVWGYDFKAWPPGRSPYDEPATWARAHASTVAWCLLAGAAIQRSATASELRALADSYPSPYGFGTRTVKREQKGLVALFPEMSALKPLERLGRLLGDTIFVNIKGVRRRIEWNGTGALRTMWGGTSLLEVIYTLVADSVTGGTLVQCKADGCGAAFIQTDQRMIYCPRRMGQLKSACATRMRMRVLRRDRATTKAKRLQTIAKSARRGPER